MTVKEAIALLEDQDLLVKQFGNNIFRVTGEGLGDAFPDLSVGKSSTDYLWDTLDLRGSQFSDWVRDNVPGGEEVDILPGTPLGDEQGTALLDSTTVTGAGGATKDVRFGSTTSTPSDQPPWWPDYLGVPWPPYLMRPLYNDDGSGEIIGYEEDENAFDWDAFASMKRSFGSPEEERVLSLDDLIAEALGQVDDWSATEGLDYENLQKAQRLFDFKKQPTDSERLRLALDIAQSPSDYMTLVGLYTGAISRESPARAGERMAPLAPYLQQMAQKFFAGTSLMPQDTLTGRRLGVRIGIGMIHLLKKYLALMACQYLALMARQELPRGFNHPALLRLSDRIGFHRKITLEASPGFVAV
jgi:hypothetical protein